MPTQYPKVFPLFLFSSLSIAAQTVTVVNSADFSNADATGIPRGAVFTVFGTGLAGSTASASSLPLQTTLEGVSVNIAAGSFAVQAFLLYVSPTQINAILPSDVPDGTYLFTVVAGTREIGGANIPVTSGGFTAFTQGERGFGPAVIQQYDDTGRPALNQFSAPAAPEAIVTLWGTGLGPLPAGSDGDAPTAANLRNDITVYVDGIAATPLYAGRAPGYPGVDQINFKLPADVRPRCYVPIAISTAGRFTTGATVAISSTGGTCASEFGLPTSTMASLDAGHAVRIAVLSYRALYAQQSVESWIGDYDASYLSFLVNGAGAGLPDGIALCGFDQSFDGTFGDGYLTSFDPNIRTQPKLYGLGRDPSPPPRIISGPEGCTWSFVTVDGIAEGLQSNCNAASYQFGPGLLVSGDFPPPRPATDVATFSIQGPNQSLAASWTVLATPGDSIVLILSSHNNGGLGPPQTIQLACQLFPPANSFVFPQPDAARALGQPFTDAAVLSLTNVVYRMLPSNDPSIDLILVRTANSAIASHIL